MGSTLRRTELLALSNLRNDGRKPHEIRRMRIQITDQGTLVEMGLTTVFAIVRGPMECNRRSEEISDR
jgi:ribonuclease PH